MLFGLWNDACRDQDWNPKDDVQRDMVTREALNLHDSDDVPSWSALNDHQITALRKRLGELAANLDAAIETPAARQRRQSLWSIEASSRAMCSLGPVYSKAENSDWNHYAKAVVRDLTRGEHDQIHRLPTSSHTFVDLVNLGKLMHNRLFKACMEMKRAGALHVKNVSAYVAGLKKSVMEGREVVS